MGVTRWFDAKKGYGFIAAVNDTDPDGKPRSGSEECSVFCHRTACKGGIFPYPNETVEYECGMHNGRVVALNVTGPGGSDIKGMGKVDKLTKRQLRRARAAQQAEQAQPGQSGASGASGASSDKVRDLPGQKASSGAVSHAPSPEAPEFIPAEFRRRAAAASSGSDSATSEAPAEPETA